MVVEEVAKSVLLPPLKKRNVYDDVVRCLKLDMERAAGRNGEKMKEKVRSAAEYREKAHLYWFIFQELFGCKVNLSSFSIFAGDDREGEAEYRLDDDVPDGKRATLFFRLVKVAAAYETSVCQPNGWRFYSNQTSAE